jgi:hypothetical protein
MGRRQTPDEPSKAERAYLNRGVLAHRRDMLRRIGGPLFVVAVILMLVPALLTVLFASGRLGTIASFMSLCILAPLSLACFLPYAALVAMIFGLSKAYGKTSSVMRGLYLFTHRMNRGVQGLSKRIAGPVISVSARLARLERLAGLEPPSALPSTVTEPKTDERE